MKKLATCTVLAAILATSVFVSVAVKPNEEFYKAMRKIAEDEKQMEQMDHNSDEYKTLRAMKQLIADEYGDYHDEDADLDMDLYEESRRMALKQLDLSSVDPTSEEYKTLMAMREQALTKRDPSECADDDSLCLHLAAIQLPPERADESLALLTRAIAVEPRQPGIYKSRAVLYLRMDKPKKALEDAEAALRLNPRDDTARTYREKALKRIDFQSSVATGAENACEDGDMDCYADLTNAYLEKGDFNAMLQPLSAMIEHMTAISSDYPAEKIGVFYCIRAKIYFELERYQEALDDAEAALRFNAADERAAEIRDEAKLRLGVNNGDEQQLPLPKLEL